MILEVKFRANPYTTVKTFPAKKQTWPICKICSKLKLLKTLWPLFIDGVQQLSQSYREKVYTTMRQFTYYLQALRRSWYSFDRPRKDESRGSNHTVVLNLELLDRESSALTNRPLLREPSPQKEHPEWPHLISFWCLCCKLWTDLIISPVLLILTFKFFSCCLTWRYNIWCSL